MKKILTIIISTVALWAISTFIISNQTENELENYVNKSNKIYNNSGLSLKLLDYNKSFLSSTALLEIDIIDPEIIKILEKDFNFPLKMNYNIEHGPLFFKNGFGIGLAKIEHDILLTSIFKKEVKKDLLELFKKDINFHSNMIVSFNKKMNYSIISDSLQFEKDSNKFLMTPIRIKGVSNLDNFQGTALLTMKNLLVNKEGTINKFEINDLALDVNIKELLDNTLFFGDIELSIKNLIFIDEKNPKLEKINLGFNAKIVSEKVNDTMMNNTFNGEINLENTVLPDELKNLKNLYLTMNLENLGIQGMLELQKSIQKMQKAQNKLLLNMQTKSDEEMSLSLQDFSDLQKNILTNIISSMNTLLIKDKTNITYGLDIETRDNQKTKIMTQVEYTGDIDFKGSIEELAKKAQAKILTLLALNINIDLSKEHFKLVPNANMLQPQIDMAVMQGFVKENNSSYILNGYYKNKELIVNDNNLTSMILPFIIMATQGQVQ